MTDHPHSPRRRIRWQQVAVLLWLAVASPSLLAAGPARPRAQPGRADSPEFLRVVRGDERRPISLDTAVVTYVPRNAEAAGVAGPRDEPLRVDLVAAVHLGSGRYYESLDRLFTEYDAVLYELVAPPQARVPRAGRRPAGAIGSAQQGLTQMLGLRFQLDEIDYTAANFVHADLSPKEFDAAMARRGESWWTMFTKLMREGMARGNRSSDAADVGVGDVFSLLFGSGAERQLRLRRIMAEQFSDLETLTAAFGGEEGSTLITDRNAAAIGVLRQQIAAGRRRIAIFYGAAHMDDFDRRLQAEFGLQRGETAWLEAWDLRDPVPVTSGR